MDERWKQQKKLDDLRRSKPLSHWWLDTDCAPTFKSMEKCLTCGKPFVRVGYTRLHEDSPLHRAWKELDNA